MAGSNQAIVEAGTHKSPVTDTKLAGEDGPRPADGITGLCMFLYFFVHRTLENLISSDRNIQTKEMSSKHHPRIVVNSVYLAHHC
jgi:hypothetical protein